MAMLKVGDAAPEIDLASTTGARFRLADRAGRWTVVYFFPRAFTPNCTRESARFRDNHDDILALDAEVVGISADPLPRQCDFAASLRVRFPLLADEDRSVQRAYGVPWPMLDRPRRATFVIGPDLRIAAVFQHEFQVSKHLDDVVAFLRRSRTAP